MYVRFVSSKPWLLEYIDKRALRITSFGDTF